MSEISALKSSSDRNSEGGGILHEAPAVSPGAIYQFSFRAKQFAKHFASVQQYQVQWLGSNGAVVSGTGWRNFSGGDGAWVLAENSPLTAPNNAVAGNSSPN